MHYLSQALEWVRGVLFGARTPSGHGRACAASFTPGGHPQQWRSPESGSAYLRLARARRAARAGRAQPPVPASPKDLRVLVPLYVLSPAERERTLSLPAGAGREVLR